MINIYGVFASSKQEVLLLKPVKKGMFVLKSTILFLVFVSLFSCKNNDDDEFIQILVSVEDQAVTDDSDIVEFLSSHYYNEEEFTNAANITDFDYDIDFSDQASITGYDSNNDGVINAADIDDTTVFNRTKLIDLLGGILETKNVEVKGVDHKLYILKVREGSGAEQPKYSDSSFIEYKGIKLDKTPFDASQNPIWLELSKSIRGFAQSISEFKTASGTPIDNGDGTYTFNDFGVGAVIMPSGLAYFNSPPSGSTIGVYSPLVFSFNLMDAKLDTDHDTDNVASHLEDINGNEYLEDDDTDGDGIPDYADPDDDGDGIATKDEDYEADSDLLVDRDGDGDPTNDIGDGDPTNDDTDGDGVPNYLDSDS